MNPLVFAVAFAPLVAAISAGVGLTIGPILIYIFTALGVGFISYVGFGALFNGLESLVASHFAGLPVQLVGYIGLAKVDVACSMILSALSIKITLKTVAGVVRRVTLT